MSNESDPGLLEPVARAHKRAELGLHGGPPFTGIDLWTAYEISWLDPKGKPRIAIATFGIPASTPRLIESKSMKLYLHSLNQSPFNDAAAVRATIARDLGAASGAPVSVTLTSPEEFSALAMGDLEGESIDDLDLEVRPEPPHRELLSVSTEIRDESLVTNLLKTNCPLTGQPDWASLQVRYRGPRIDREGLLRYVVAFRLHRDFHEHCVERIYMDVLARCRPERLTVYARYTRRGGIDINPFRTNCGDEPDPRRAPRQ